MDINKIVKYEEILACYGDCMLEVGTSVCQKVESYNNKEK